MGRSALRRDAKTRNAQLLIIDTSFADLVRRGDIRWGALARVESSLQLDVAIASEVSNAVARLQTRRRLVQVKGSHIALTKLIKSGSVELYSDSDRSHAGRLLLC